MRSMERCRTDFAGIARHPYARRISIGGHVLRRHPQSWDAIHDHDHEVIRRGDPGHSRIRGLAGPSGQRHGLDDAEAVPRSDHRRAGGRGPRRTAYDIDLSLGTDHGDTDDRDASWNSAARKSDLHIPSLVAVGGRRSSNWEPLTTGAF